MNTPQSHEPDADESGGRIISPFAQTTSTVKAHSNTGGSHWPFWVVSGLLTLTVLGIASYFLLKYLNDPYRTLETFPIAKYMDDYRTLSGAKFKSDMKVSADLGWKEGVGHLMVFATESDPHLVVVLVPSKLSGIFFTKGQSYLVSLEVGEGGLIYADSCEKE